LLVAASAVAVLVLAVAGINQARKHSASSDGALSNGIASAPMRSGVKPNPPGPNAALGSGSEPGQIPAAPAYQGPLDCSGIPGGVVSDGARASVRMSATGEYRFVYEYLCIGANGARSASEVQEFQVVGGKLVYLQTLVHQALQLHVRQLISGVDSVQLQVTNYLSALDGPSGALQTERLLVGDPSGGFGSEAVGEDVPVCAAKDLTVTVATPAGRPSHAVLQLRNHTSSPCVLEGFPKVIPFAGSARLDAAAIDTLTGSAGGVRSSRVPPIVEVGPGAVASSLIDSKFADWSGCAQADRLQITLPTGVALGAVGARIGSCALGVHPFVDNATGSD
jgi:hypothetical protein